MAACEAVNKSVVPAKTAAAERQIATKSLSQILEETAKAVNRPVLWLLEAMAFVALTCCLALLPLLHGEGTRSAMGLAAGYFTLSGLLGAYILLLGKDRARRGA
ncbi:MAG TPA: hypothetical protein VMT61_03920 [Candidatus Binataceae bacterium]|nr:hypothetical protein [Candidatus Binataceae bacterium]